VHVVKWRTSLIAWANDVGAKIYDTVSYQHIAFIERVPHSGLLRHQLVLHIVKDVVVVFREVFFIT
jgi:hypothetical protein